MRVLCRDTVLILDRVFRAMAGGVSLLAALASWGLLGAESVEPPFSREIDFEGAEGGDWRTEGSVESADGVAGKGLLIRQPGAGVQLDLSGPTAHSLLQHGSIRFRFRPEWASGKGPGHWASFVSTGVWTPDPPTIGYWALGINPTGDQVVFSGQAVGRGMVYLSVPVQFQAGMWYDLLLTYSPTSSRLFVDGRELGPGNGVVIYPSEEVLREHGLKLGNNHSGQQPIAGTIDQFEIHSSPLSDFVQRREKLAITAESLDSPRGVSLSWPKFADHPLGVKRRLIGSPKWTDLAVVSKTTQFIDRSRDLLPGARYEYQVGDKRLAVIVGTAPPIERRGRVLLVVANNLVAALKEELARLQNDLEGDGWEVVIESVERHDSRFRSRYQNRLQETRARIHAFYRAAPQVPCVALLIGNVTIPYSGFRAEDMHTTRGDDHRGAWPCDAYYGDVDGLWTDEMVDHSNRTHIENSNRPGDGKFDQDNLPSPLEIAIGRIDFSGMPSIGGDSFPGNPSDPLELELAMTRRYLEKVHRFRFGELSFQRRAVYVNHLPRFIWGNMDHNAFRTGNALFGDSNSAILEEDCFLLANPVLWGFMGGYGGQSSVASGRYQTVHMNQLGAGPRAAFLMFFSSWAADWNLPDALLKSTLLGDRAGLVSMSSLHGQWQLSSLAVGEPLATAYLETASEMERGRPVSRSLGMLGDITLRMDVIPPVEELSAVKKQGGVELTWQRGESVDGFLGFYVYRRRSGEKSFDRISGEKPLSKAGFHDSNGIIASDTYMIRAVAVQRTPAGKYINLSQGSLVP